MQRSHPIPALKVHRRRGIKQAVVATVGVVLLFSTSAAEFAQASAVGLQNQTTVKTGTTRTLASTAGYLFDLRLDISTDGGQPARTSFLGQASLAEVDATTSRIQIQSIQLSQTDDTGAVQPVELSAQSRASLQDSFDVNSGGTPTLLVGQTEPEEVINIKRALAKQIALTPNENQSLATQLAVIRADVTDGFGTFKNRASLARSKGKVVLKESRTEADYTRLAVPQTLNPDVVVQNTNVYNQSTGLLESSQTFEAITVDYGTLPESAQNPTGAGARIQQSASSRMRVSRSGQGEPVASPNEPQHAVPIDTVATDEMERNARKASAPTFEEAMAVIATNPQAPSSALGLSARLQADPLAMVSLGKTLQAGSVSPELLPAITAALMETNTTEAQLILATSILGRSDLTAEQRQHLALSIASIENPTPDLLIAVRSAKGNELLTTEVRRPERPDPTECELDPDCTPGGGGPTGTGTPPVMTFPYSKIWNQRIGNAVLGADIGAGISITRNANTTNDYNSDTNAYAKGLVLGQEFSVVDANLKTISDANGNRRVEASIDIRGRGRETFTTSGGCDVNMGGNFYAGTLPFFATNFWIPVGPVIFYGGASAAGHVSLPWSVQARTCGGDGYTVGRFDPNVFVEVRAYGGISIFIASAGLEAIGTIAKLTMSPSARILWKPTISPDAAAEFRLQMAFQPFSLRVRAWLRVLFWTKRWTLAEWSTPTRIWVAALAQTANWNLVYWPNSAAIAAPPLPGLKASVAIVNTPPPTQQPPTTTPTPSPVSQGSKPVSAQMVIVPTTAPGTSAATTVASPTTTPATTTTITTVPQTTITPTTTTTTTSATQTTKPPVTTSSTTVPVTTMPNPTGTKPVPVVKPIQQAADSIIPTETETVESKV